MSLKQTLSGMFFDAAVMRVKKQKSFWTVWFQIRDIHVFVTVFNNDVLPVIEMTDGKDRFRTSNFDVAVETLTKALCVVTL